VSFKIHATWKLKIKKNTQIHKRNTWLHYKYFNQNRQPLIPLDLIKCDVITPLFTIHGLRSICRFRTAVIHYDVQWLSRLLIGLRRRVVGVYFRSNCGSCSAADAVSLRTSNVYRPTNRRSLCAGADSQADKSFKIVLLSRDPMALVLAAGEDLGHRELRPAVGPVLNNQRGDQSTTGQCVLHWVSSLACSWCPEVLFI